MPGLAWVHRDIKPANSAVLESNAKASISVSACGNWHCSDCMFVLYLVSLVLYGFNSTVQMSKGVGMKWHHMIKGSLVEKLPSYEDSKKAIKKAITAQSSNSSFQKKQ